MYRSIVATAAAWLGLSVFGIDVSAQVPQDVATLSAAANRGTKASDVVLDNQLLRGRLVDRDGAPVSGTRIVLGNRSKTTGVTSADRSGRFHFRGVKSGTWILRAGQESHVVRAWRADVAPPSARAEVMLVSRSNLVRGQCAGPDCAGCPTCAAFDGHFAYRGHFGGVFQRILQNPWLTGLGTAAAIAVPLATDDDDRGGNTVRTSEGLSDPDAS